MNRRYITLPMLLLVLSLSSGCAGYEEPTLPDDQVAVLRLACCSPGLYVGARHVPSGESFYVRKIDGKPANFEFGQTKTKLLPGQHTVSAEHITSTGGQTGTYYLNLGSGVQTAFSVFASLMNPRSRVATIFRTEEDLTFEAEAGHTYDIGPFWIKDTTTGEIVFDRTKFLAEKEREKLLVDAERGGPNAQIKLYRHLRNEPSNEALRWLCLAANQDHALGQEYLGDLHAWGESGLVELDRVRAYMWYSLAAANGNPRAGFARDDLADQMTPAQIAEAERLAAEWKPGDCGAPPKSASAH